jgi:hypothetical protein
VLSPIRLRELTCNLPRHLPSILSLIADLVPVGSNYCSIELACTRR